MSNSAIDTNALKWVGSAGKEVGKFIGKLPFVKEGPIDELLQDGGEKLRSNALKRQEKVVRGFAPIRNTGTGVIIDKMNDLIQISHHTSQISFDDRNVYLIAN